MTTRVVHCKREPYDVYVGRPGPFGNPFKVGVHGERGECVELYRQWIMQPGQWDLRERMKKELRGKILGCWCAPRLCHGDVILEIANE